MELSKFILVGISFYEFYNEIENLPLLEKEKVFNELSVFSEQVEKIEHPVVVDKLMKQIKIIFK